MKKASILHRTVLALLPATLLVAACGKSDTPAPTPAPDQAQVNVVHDAANSSAFPIKVQIGAAESPAVLYGANSGYQSFGTGSLEVKTSIAAAGGAVLNTETKAIGKDKRYSYFVYSAVGQPANMASGLWTEDDLTAPASGQAKIRLVHVGQGLVSPLGLSKPDNSGMLVAVVPTTGTGAASAFVSVPAGTASYNLVNSTNNTIIPFAGGTTVLATNFAAGKIYTIVIRGSSNAATDKEKFTLDLIIQN